MTLSKQSGISKPKKKSLLITIATDMIATIGLRTEYLKLLKVKLFILR